MEFFRNGFALSKTTFFAVTSSCVLALAADSYSLRTIYRAGDVHKFSTTVSFTLVEPAAGTVKLEVATTSTEVTKEVTRDGTVTIVETTDSGRLSVNGEPKPFPDLGKSTITTFDSTGRLLDYKGGGPTFQGEMQQFLPYFQRGNIFAVAPPLKIGEIWKYDIPSGIGTAEPSRLTGSIKLVGLEQPSTERPVAALRALAKGAAIMHSEGDILKLTIDCSALIEQTTGRPLRTEATINSQVQRGRAKGTMSMRMTRVMIVTPLR